MTAATILVIRDFNIQIKGWRPVLESNPWRRLERDAIDCNSIELRGMDSTLPHLKDSGGTHIGRSMDARDCGGGSPLVVTRLEF